MLLLQEYCKKHLNDIKENIKSSKNDMEKDFYKGRYAVQLLVYAKALNVRENIWKGLFNHNNE